ncbi:MAG: biotin/lipoyl-binding protein [Clostridia bacterium]|nr:biotin/lipoyl-binding protein [Clostridia bacterium]
MRKKTKALVCLAAVCLLLTAAFLGCAEKTEKTVSVQSVAMLMDVQTGQISRYGGVVVSQNEKTIKRDETKTIQEILVKEGDLVEEGQILVTYDQEDMKLTIQKAELELEQLRNSITTYGEQIAQLERRRRRRLLRNSCPIRSKSRNLRWTARKRNTM